MTNRTAPSYPYPWAMLDGVALDPDAPAMAWPKPVVETGTDAAHGYETYVEVEPIVVALEPAATSPFMDF